MLIINYLFTDLVVKFNSKCFLQVAWLRSDPDTGTLLTVHTSIIAKDSRLRVTHNNRRQWYLHIKEVLESDRGFYMCQINTEPMLNQIGFLDVLGKCFSFENCFKPSTNTRTSIEQDFFYNIFINDRYSKIHWIQDLEKKKKRRKRLSDPWFFSSPHSIYIHFFLTRSYMNIFSIPSSSRQSLYYRWIHPPPFTLLSSNFFLFYSHIFAIFSFWIFLNPAVPPSIAEEETSSDVVVDERSKMSLRCKANGYPAPKITWRREDGKPLNLGSYSGHKQIGMTSSL